mgnify:CR=1 FL=1
MDKKVSLKTKLKKYLSKEKELRLKFEKLVKEIGENNTKIIILKNKLKELEENND